MNNMYAQYQTNGIMTATPGELTLMLYNGAIKFCNITIEALENNNLQKANESNQRVQDIITELQATLDTKYEIGKQMDQLYNFILELLVEGNIHKDRQKIVDAQELIREFRDMWKEVIKKK